ncbi:integral peroxisomal membrane peroxin-domain-containing protein [Podospora appendiculata]|uniref:Integral peroxisomal membrane peroxin-domain-containing protein n=1 Tax=Podospora appendiculata TaxID=314037 RepID=A0AAE0X5W4_9PEZI|nr:integral peroxisomal membrane peroxin-domain-containing protein [Podospora appendiculata]
MDDLIPGILLAGDDNEPQDEAQPDSAKTARSLSRGIFKAASLQDKLLEKLLSQVLPADDAAPGQAPGLAGGGGSGSGSGSGSAPSTFHEDRPGFTVGAMSNNFRRFNARIGVVFTFQTRLLRLLSWRRPTHTLSLLAVYTFVCLDPYLLCILPLAVALLGILVPSFVARHPAPLSDSEHRVRNLGYSPRGPPLAPARVVKPAKELSRDFFRNMGDLQNCMEDFSVAHDKIIALVVPKTNFSDEALSSAIFVLLFAACAVMSIAAHLLPWRFLALVAGWAAICSGHPAVARMIAESRRQYIDSPAGPAGATQRAFDAWVTSDIILDEAPETREVEIFELQRLDDANGEWDAWLFSPSPYDPLSAARISGDRPRGTRFFEDVLPPEGWEWSGKKWALDLWSREWVEERIITGVEVETEGERWVYDIYNEHAEGGGGGGGGGGGDGPGPGPGSLRGANGTRDGYGQAHAVSWEEGEEGMGRRGEWRRRRWVRTVKRRKVGSSA